jgi:hypothetical protein
MQTSTGTVVDIKIINWRLYLLISTKSCFTDDVTELSDPNDDPGTTSFSIGLTIDPHSLEARNPTYNEPTVSVQKIPGKLYISKAQTLFKELNQHSATLLFTLTAHGQRYGSDQLIPWDFWFRLRSQQSFRSAESLACHVCDIQRRRASSCSTNWTWP